MSPIDKVLITECLRHSLSPSPALELALRESQQLVVDNQDLWVEHVESAVSRVAHNSTPGYLRLIFSLVITGFKEWQFVSSCSPFEAKAFVTQFADLVSSTARSVSTSLSVYELRLGLYLLLAGHSMLHLFEAQFPGIIDCPVATYNALAEAMRSMAASTRGARADTEALVSLVSQFLLSKNPRGFPLIPRLFQWTPDEPQNFGESPLTVRVRTADVAISASFVAAFPATTCQSLVSREGMWRLALRETGELELVLADGSLGERINRQKFPMSGNFKLAVIQERGFVHVFCPDSGAFLLTGRLPEPVEDRPAAADFVVLGAEDSAGISGVLHHVDSENIWGTNFGTPVFLA